MSVKEGAVSTDPACTHFRSAKLIEWKPVPAFSKILHVQGKGVVIDFLSKLAAIPDPAEAQMSTVYAAQLRVVSGWR